MSETPTAQRLTAEEFAELPDDGRRRELIRGEVVEMTPASGEHGYYAGQVQGALLAWLAHHPVGYCLTNDVGVVVEQDPDTVLAPDAAFYLKSTLVDPRVRGFLMTIPDLVVEVVSANDRRGDVVAKAARWLQAGVRVVWVVWPATRQVSIYGPDDVIDVLNVGDTLTCEPLLPGFALSVESIFTT